MDIRYCKCLIQSVKFSNGGGGGGGGGDSKRSLRKVAIFGVEIYYCILFLIFTFSFSLSSIMNMEIFVKDFSGTT